MGRCRLELGDRGAATGAWQAYLQVLTPSGPSGGTGNAPGTAGCSAGVPNLAKLEEEGQEQPDVAAPDDLPGSYVYKKFESSNFTVGAGPTAPT